MDESQTPTDPSATPDVTQIPITDEHVSTDAAPAPEPPVVDQPNPDAQPSVPGTPVTPAAPAESTAVVQPTAPNPVPATAEPAQDAVTVNANWEKVVSDLGTITDYIKTNLAFHDLAQDVITDVEAVVNKVLNRG